MKNVKNIEFNPCTPPRWAKNKHMQTIVGYCLRPKSYISFEEHVIDFADGDKSLAYYHPGYTETVVHIFHGLGGHARASYMLRAANVAARLGHHVFLHNHRGCGEASGWAKNIYHSGRSDDLSTFIKYGKQKFPEHTHLAVAFSISGNTLLFLLSNQIPYKTLHKHGIEPEKLVKPDLAISINAPVCLSSSSERVSKGFNKLYETRFRKRLKNIIKDLKQSGGFSRQGIQPWSKRFLAPPFCAIKYIDDTYIGPLSGYSDAHEYYESCSSKYYIDAIDRPTVILTSEDDPLVNFAAYEELPENPFIHYHFEKTGGHMGYVTKTKFGVESWLDHTLERYIIELLKYKKNQQPRTADGF